MKKALRMVVLAVTSLALLATSTDDGPSCPPGNPLMAGPVQLAVDTTCGPAGAVTLTVEPDTCAVTLEGAAAAGLPSKGRLDEGTLRLEEDAGGDPTLRCRADERAPGEWTARCYARHETNATGCGGADLPACEGLLTVVPP